MAQDPLITRRDILNHGAGNDFVDQFRIRPIEVQVQATGELGTAMFAWRLQGNEDWSKVEPSESGSSWTWDVPDPSYAQLVFAARTYTEGETWTVSTSGVVRPQGSALSGVMATRINLITTICDGVTSDIVMWMQPRVVAPVLSLGEGQKGWAAALAIYRLKSRQGMTPAQAGSGDENLRARALDAELNFKAIGRSDSRPPDIVDSSPSGKGRGIPLMPRSRSPRGFGDFS